MNNKASSIQKYRFSPGEKILLDANIWLYLFPAPSSPKLGFVSAYSAAFKSMIAANCSIIVNSLILSEYLNRYCRIEWEAIHKATYPTFKQFRKSKDYLGVGQNAAAFGDLILKRSSAADDDFSAANHREILAGFESGESDFNDGLIADACMRNAWTLVTHDADFVRGGIKILTESARLLKACA